MMIFIRKRKTIVLCSLLLIISMLSLTACISYNHSNSLYSALKDEIKDENYEGSTIPVDKEKYNTTSIYTEIIIKTEIAELNAVLFDNMTARVVANMFPLTVPTWHPATDFARAFDLPERFSYFTEEPPQMSYELGSLAYWEPGPSIAMIYKASRTQTVVPVVPIGKITSNVSILENYSGTITIVKMEGK